LKAFARLRHDFRLAASARKASGLTYPIDQDEFLQLDLTLLGDLAHALRRYWQTTSRR
jgi:hypothetical protein